MVANTLKIWHSSCIWEQE